MTEKREQIEKALGRYHREIDDVCGFKVAPGLDYDALAEQAIVIECEVDYVFGYPGSGQAWEVMKSISHADRRGLKHYISYRGKEKFSGKAIAIILSLDKK